jgi:hypothetical protein
MAARIDAFLLGLQSQAFRDDAEEEEEEEEEERERKKGGVSLV